MRAVVVLVCLFFIQSVTKGQVANNSKERVTIQSEYTYAMLEQNQNLRKVNIMLERKEIDQLRPGTLILGASLVCIADFQVSNTDSKFGYLMRHPTSNNQVGTTVSEAAVHSFQFMVGGFITEWLGFHSELLYNPMQSFGTGTITSVERNQIELRRAFILFGNTKKNPFYGAIGKMDAPFGLTGSVNPFTNSTMWHAFGGLGFGAQVGFKRKNLSMQFMGVQGGSQFRAMHTPVGDSTNVPSQLNNFCADINYAIVNHQTMKLVLGGSYLHGSAYCQDFPVTHFTSCGDRNPAYSYYGRLLFKDRLLLMGGYAETFEEWKGTHNPNPPLDVFPAHKVSSADIGIKYSMEGRGSIRYDLSFEFSNFKAGAEGCPWERQNQYIAGFSLMLYNSTKFYVELFRTEGYVPLNFISGSDPFEPFPPGTTHSSREAMSHGILIGALLTL